MDYELLIEINPSTRHRGSFSDGMMHLKLSDKSFAPQGDSMQGIVSVLQ